MTTVTAPRTPSTTPTWKKVLRRASDRRYMPVAGSVLTLVLMLVIGEMRYGGSNGFVTPRLLSNLLVDNSYLLVLAIGMTFVIITGGIDLSVGAVVALTGLVIATLLPMGLPLPVVLLVAVLIGSVMGLIIGVMVQYFHIQPFIASLGVMFLARGLANAVSVNSLGIDHPGFSALVSWNISVGEKSQQFKLNAAGLIALVLLAVAFYLLHYSRFGRTVYGVGVGDGGNAIDLMGLRTGRTVLWVYVISGTCAGIAGILFAMYTKSGFNLTGIGMELDAIAAVVIGGTILTGGGGYILGTAVGVAVYGLIQVLISREGLGEAWWTKIFIGVILLAFVILQRFLTARRR
jgi:ribose/xylose/arabinose/galactoside ABC-type transport system permease subunit